MPVFSGLYQFLSSKLDRRVTFYNLLDMHIHSMNKLLVGQVYLSNLKFGSSINRTEVQASKCLQIPCISDYFKYSTTLFLLTRLYPI